MVYICIMITKMKGRTVGEGVLGQEAEEERMGGGRLLNGWEAGEKIEVNIIFAIKKRSKGRKPR